MPGHASNFRERQLKRLICPLCHLPMNDPVQITACDHRYCDSCLQTFLSDGVFRCPEDDLPLDYATIYPDPDLNAEIMSQIVRCKHYKEGCKWTDKLINLQAHLDICRYDAVPCPHKCAAMLSRICLEDHMKYTCPKRKVTCEFCSQEFTGESMENHDGNCPYETVWCENKCGARLQQRYLDNHMKNECHKRLVPCAYCQKQFVYDTLQTHQYNCVRFPVNCPNRCDPTKIPREEVEKHVQGQCPSATIACSFQYVGCKHRCPRYSLDKHLEEYSKHHLSLMGDVVLKQRLEIDQLREGLDNMAFNTDGVLIWKIPNFKSKLAEAKTKTGHELASLPFHTHKYGYRLSASVFLNGNGSGEGKFLSLYIRIMKGDFDNLLDWPFQMPITFTLYDQCVSLEKRINVTESFLPDPSWKHFQKPSTDEEAMGFGYPKFVSHETLKTKSYVKDDMIYIKVQVDTSTFILP